MPDSPENNFATFNSLYVDADSTPTLSEGNLRTDSTSSSWFNSTSTFMVSSGKWYAEMCMNSSSDVFISIGKAPSTSTYIGTDTNGYAYLSNNGQIYHNSSGSSYGNTFGSGDVIGVALDLDNGNLYFYKNGTIQNSGTPAVTGLSGSWFISCSSAGTSGEVRANFGQDATFQALKTSGSDDASDSNGKGTFYETPPSGYLALCTSNLPEPTISPNADTQADDYFNTVLYTGNATDNTAIAVDFQPDWTWIKKRSSAQEHVLFDSNRGATKRLFSNLTNAESDSATSLKAFTSTGFTLGTDSNVNDNTETFVAWNWKANGGTTSSNSDGSITSTVQANTTAGFSIVTYTGTGANATVGHGLGVAPRWIIMKRTDSAQNWVVYHEEIGNDRELLLNVGNQQTNSSSTFFQSTSPTTSVFSLGSDNYANASSGTYVAYCFAEVEGYSKIGKYNPNNTTDNVFVYTGFKPAMVILKGAEINNQEWCILDNKRPGYNSVYNLNPNYANAETTSNIVDFVSNGFKIRETGGVGYLTSKYIYIAFAKAPFKYANGG